MPTWWIGFPKNTRSPGWSSDCETCGNDRYCASALWGSATPAAAHAYIVRPEQSKTSGPDPAYTYGLPSCARAVSTATCADPLGAGTLPGEPALGSVTSPEPLEPPLSVVVVC